MYKASTSTIGLLIVTPLKTLKTLRSLHICSVARTHRGNTAGINHFRSIPTAITFDRNFPKAALSGANCVNYNNITRVPLVSSSSSSNQREPDVKATGISTFTRGCRAGRDKQQPIGQTTGHRPSSTFVYWQHSVSSANLASLRIPPAMPHVEFVNVALLNVRSVCNKALQINEYLVKHKWDVLAITETWLRETGDEAMIAEVTPRVSSSSMWRGHLDTVELLRLQFSAVHSTTFNMWVI